MKVTTEKIDNHKVVLEITVPQEEVKKGLDLAFAKLSKKINIPGFRKGKVPRNVLISKIGKQALLEEAFDIVAPNALNKALVEQNLDPVVKYFDESCAHRNGNLFSVRVYKIHFSWYNRRNHIFVVRQYLHLTVFHRECNAFASPDIELSITCINLQSKCMLLVHMHTPLLL